MNRLTSLDIEERRERDYKSLQRINPRQRSIAETDEELTISEETPLLSNGSTPTYTQYPDVLQDRLKKYSNCNKN